MIYLDASVALAHLLAEDRHPPGELWAHPLVSSRLLEYEIWTRIHGYGLEDSHADAVRTVIGRVSLVKLDPVVLARALDPFPQPVRTLDAVHLATIHYLLDHGQDVRLASYDERMLAVAMDLGWAVHACG